MQSKILLLAAALTVPFLLPGAGAALLPAPDERPYETRLIHDNADEPLSILDAQHGFDAVALDVREAYDPLFGENMFVFRLTLDQGCDLLVLDPCPTLQQTIEFNSSSASHTYTFASDDGGATFYGNMDWYSAPEAINGTQFAVEGGLRFSRAGVAPGDTLGDWFSHGYSGQDEADHMNIGIAAGVPDLLEYAYNIGEYTVRAPDYYADLRIADEAIEIAPGASVSTRMSYELENLLPMNQSIRLDMSSTPGIEAFFIDPASNLEKKTLDLTFAANETKELEMVLRSSSTQDISRVMTVLARTEFGGLSQDAIRLDVDSPTDNQAPPAPTTSTQTVTITGAPAPGPAPEPEPDGSGSESKDSPGVELVAIAIGLLGVALLVRRRS